MAAQEAAVRAAAAEAVDYTLQVAQVAAAG